MLMRTQTEGPSHHRRRRRRVRLASCCRALRERTAASRGLWGDLKASLFDKSASWANSLALWLAAHKGGLASLQLSMYGADIGRGSEAEAAQRLLSAMAGSGSLASLELEDLPGEADLSPLAQLPGLTSLTLDSCGLTTLPPQLASLPLADLKLTSCRQLERGGNAGFEPLAALGGSLRRLRCTGSRLERAPAALAALSGLQELHLELDGGGEPSALADNDCCQALGRLTRLTRLTLGGRMLVRLPNELSALTGLKVRYAASPFTAALQAMPAPHMSTHSPMDAGLVSFTQAVDLEAVSDAPSGIGGAWGLLQHLRQLTLLTLGGGVGSALPAELAECTALVELSLHARKLQSSEAAWAPLARLTCLTRLTGARVPGALAHLPPSLLSLAVTGDLSGASDGEFDGLGRATALTHLYIR